MTLLSDARNGRKGGVLPWALLIICSGASLAANVAVADPTMWLRIIHAWPSFALIGAYELLMREFRTAAGSVRSAHADRTHTDERSAEPDEAAFAPAPAERQERPRLHVVSAGKAVEDGGGEHGQERSDRFPPRIQREAWAWALENRQLDGSLPTGGQISEHFGRKERWGRLIKQWRQQGRLDPSLESSLTEVT